MFLFYFWQIKSQINNKKKKKLFNNFFIMRWWLFRILLYMYLHSITMIISLFLKPRHSVRNCVFVCVRVWACGLSLTSWNVNEYNACIYGNLLYRANRSLNTKTCKKYTMITYKGNKYNEHTLTYPVCRLCL